MAHKYRAHTWLAIYAYNYPVVYSGLKIRPIFHLVVLVLHVVIHRTNINESGCRH